MTQEYVCATDGCHRVLYPHQIRDHKEEHPNASAYIVQRRDRFEDRNPEVEL